MHFQSEFRNMFSFSSTSYGQKCMQRVADVILDLADDASDLLASDVILLLTYRLTVTSSSLCASLLSWKSDTQYIRTTISILSRKGLLVKYPISLYSNSLYSVADIRSVVCLSEEGIKYLCRKFALPELPSWMHTTPVRCLHDYQNTLTIVQLLLQRVIDSDRHRGKPYIPSLLSGESDDFSKEYMLDRKSYNTARQENFKGKRNLIADSIYTINGNSDNTYHEDDYTRSYLLAPVTPLTLDDTRPARLPLNIFIETDMRTERNPVIVEKLAQYTDAKTFSRTGTYAYWNSCLLFSCFALPPAPAKPWSMSNAVLETLLKRSQSPDNGSPVSRNDFPALITDLPQNVQQGYLEVNEFYSVTKDCKTAQQLIERYKADRANLRSPLLAQYNSEFHAKKCRDRLSRVYKEIYRELEDTENEMKGKLSIADSQLSCCKVIREFLNGLRCYFLPVSTIWQTASRLYHNPDLLAWITNKYFGGSYISKYGIHSQLLNAKENGVQVAISAYQQMPNEKVPALSEGLFLHFPQCITFKRSDMDKNGHTVVIEDLSDLGTWVRITEYFKKFPKGTSDIRIACLYQSREDVEAFVNATGIYGSSGSGIVNVFLYPENINFISYKSYQFSGKEYSINEIMAEKVVALKVNGKTVIKDYLELKKEEQTQ